MGFVQMSTLPELEAENLQNLNRTLQFTFDLKRPSNNWFHSRLDQQSISVLIPLLASSGGTQWCYQGIHCNMKEREYH